MFLGGSYIFCLPRAGGDADKLIELYADRFVDSPSHLMAR